MSLADSGLVERVNHLVRQGQARDQLDQPIREEIEGGLINQDGDRLYPIRDGIPTLIADEAIGLGDKNGDDRIAADR